MDVPANAGRKMSQSPMNDPDKPDVVLIPAEPPHGASDRRTGRAAGANAGVRRFSKKQLILAFAIAGVSDIVGAAVTWFPPAVSAARRVHRGAAVHRARLELVAIAGPAAGSDPRPGSASLLGAGRRSDRPSWQPTAEIEIAAARCGSSSAAGSASAFVLASAAGSGCRD